MDGARAHPDEDEGAHETEREPKRRDAYEGCGTYGPEYGVREIDERNTCAEGGAAAEAKASRRPRAHQPHRSDLCGGERAEQCPSDQRSEESRSHDRDDAR